MPLGHATAKGGEYKCSSQGLFQLLLQCDGLWNVDMKWESIPEAFRIFLHQIRVIRNICRLSFRSYSLPQLFILESATVVVKVQFGTKVNTNNVVHSYNIRTSYLYAHQERRSPCKKHLMTCECEDFEQAARCGNQGRIIEIKIIQDKTEELSNQTEAIRLWRGILSLIYE